MYNRFMEKGIAGRSSYLVGKSILIYFNWFLVTCMWFPLDPILEVSGFRAGGLPSHRSWGLEVIGCRQLWVVVVDLEMHVVKEVGMCDAFFGIEGNCWKDGLAICCHRIRGTRSRALASEFRVSGRQRGAGSICFEQTTMRHALMFNLEVISKKNQGIYTLCSGFSSRLHVGSCAKSWKIRLDRRMLVLFGRR